jgi:hypothetical protein
MLEVHYLTFPVEPSPNGASFKPFSLATMLLPDRFEHASWEGGRNWTRKLWGYDPAGKPAIVWNAG